MLVKMEPPEVARAAGPGALNDVAGVLLVSRPGPARDRLTGLFEDAGLAVFEAAGIPAAREMMKTARPDLVVLECPSLVGDELAFCQAVAAGPGVPLLVLVAAADVVDEIVALELGADDLLIGDAADRLILARARALLRRTRPAEPARRESPHDAGGWRLDPITRAATGPGGGRVSLSPAHASAFHLFLANPGVVFTSEAGARALGAGVEGAPAFRTTVCRLRQKLDSLHDGQPIRTVRGGGYTYAPSAARSGRDALAGSGPARADDGGHAA